MCRSNKSVSFLMSIYICYAFTYEDNLLLQRQVMIDNESDVSKHATSLNHTFNMLMQLFEYYNHQFCSKSIDREELGNVPNKQRS